MEQGISHSCVALQGAWLREFPRVYINHPSSQTPNRLQVLTVATQLYYTPPSTYNMRVSTFIVALATTLAVESAAKKINMSCLFAADHTGMIQYPFCCRDMKPARGNPKANEALDCEFVWLWSCCFLSNQMYSKMLTICACPRPAIDRTSAMRGSVASCLLLYCCECACYVCCLTSKHVTNSTLMFFPGPQEDLYLARYLPGCRGRLSWKVEMRRLVVAFMNVCYRSVTTGKDVVCELIQCQYCPLRKYGRTYTGMTRISHVLKYLRTCSVTAKRGHAEMNSGDGRSNTGGPTWPQKQMDIMMLQQSNATP